MDFASLMSAQISKATPSTSTTAKSTDQKQYLKRSEVEAQRQAKYAADQEELERARLARLDKKRKAEDDEAERVRVREGKRRRLAEDSQRLREEEEQAVERARRKRLGLPDLPPSESQRGIEGTPLLEGEDDIEEDQLLSKLRELDEPARLFGESHVGRLQRYRRLTGRTSSSTPAVVMTKGPIPTSLELVPEAEMKIPDTIPTDPEKKAFLLRQLASYFTMVLSEWQVALSRREEDVKISYTGKAAYNAMVQARNNMVPLFRKLEGGELEKGILEPVSEILRCCQRRRYVDANDAYLRLSIGKA